MKVGFIGLGIMGKPMSKNMLKAGYDLVVMDHQQAPVDELVAAGAASAISPKAVAEQTEIIITMLPNSPHVKEVVLGENGIIEGARAGTCVIDMSSIAPLASREIYAELEKIGVDLLDAPVSGGEPKAIDGTISVMVGGKKEVFDAPIIGRFARMFGGIRVDRGTGSDEPLDHAIRALKAGEEVLVPQTNWSGTIVLLPPE